MKGCPECVGDALGMGGETDEASLGSGKDGVEIVLSAFFVEARETPPEKTDFTRFPKKNERLPHEAGRRSPGNSRNFTLMAIDASPRAGLHGKKERNAGKTFAGGCGTNNVGHGDACAQHRDHSLRIAAHAKRSA